MSHCIHCGIRIGFSETDCVNGIVEKCAPVSLYDKFKCRKCSFVERMANAKSRAHGKKSILIENDKPRPGKARLGKAWLGSAGLG